MNKLLLVMVAAMFLFACNSNNKPKEESKDTPKQNEAKVEQTAKNNVKKYAIESGMIKYKMKTNQVTADVTQYFKDYGRIEYTVSEFSAQGMTVKQMVLRKDGYIYSYADGQAEGQKVKDDTNMQIEDMGMITKELVEKHGGKKVGTETIAGKECEVFEIPDEENPKIVSTVCVWKTLPLKMTTNGVEASANVVMEAVEAEETSDFPEGIFELPKNVKFTEIPAAMPTMPKTDSKGDGDFDEEGAKG